ncbi:MAG: cell filamentation protein Fic [Firmicutes bacterium HGW-Firmicutes-4]|uniref:Cell filamentation protein Fic n=2 Tax=Acetobacterium malicum TaxID=52692 RepID=A0ABR6YX76_9FIRM|nr:cell filamentation protein Fic [Acetobacterium malicum]MBU4440823.1 Fic family protein [Bacillota bacterium]PKM54543.1 MAG: cell filamentation protein Fic [Firmicutes bacterium HGW-Firmicutes-3]PKM58651.1 MAG: cell filamentation protein Fic [Firmicutes bacterium HGW-Firmicutes-4]
MVQFTYNSNAIEGNTLTLGETAMVLEGLTIDQKPLKDHLEAIGHRDAFEYIKDLVSEKAILSEAVIKNIHSLVLINRPKDKGIYRRIPVSIAGAFIEPVQPVQIQPSMEELILKNEQWKSTLHPIERVARFHLEFEGIHPFIDGNGRTGRLILNLDLMQNNYLPVNVKFSDRKKYYEAFDTYFKNDDVSAMAELIGINLLERINEYINILSDSQTLENNEEWEPEQ